VTITGHGRRAVYAQCVPDRLMQQRALSSTDWPICMPIDVYGIGDRFTDRQELARGQLTSPPVGAGRMEVMVAPGGRRRFAAGAAPRGCRCPDLPGAAIDCADAQSC